MFEGVWTHQCVQGLVGCLPRLQAIVDLVGPRTHLHSADELWLDDGFLVEAR